MLSELSTGLYKPLTNLTIKIVLEGGEKIPKDTVRSFTLVKFQFFWMLLARCSKNFQINTPVIIWVRVTVLFIATLSVKEKLNTEKILFSFYLYIKPRI